MLKLPRTLLCLPPGCRYVLIGLTGFCFAFGDQPLVVSTKKDYLALLALGSPGCQKTWMLGSSSGCFSVKARARVVGMGKKERYMLSVL
jgi:hypothetical protein